MCQRWWLSAVTEDVLGKAPTSEETLLDRLADLDACDGYVVLVLRDDPGGAAVQAIGPFYGSQAGPDAVAAADRVTARGSFVAGPPPVRVVRLHTR